MIHTIETPLKKIDRIFHLADIHIRLYKRKDEYQEVFKTLYEDIKNRIQENDIIIVVGDIVHAKTEMSPEMINLASDFLKNLSDMAPTIVIAGNHDANLNNMDRMDAITPIVENIKNNNLIYLKHSGLYKMANITFSVMSVFEKKEKYKRANVITSNTTKIALFHGPVNNSMTDTGHVIVNDKMEVSFFDGFDMVLLGDIHKRQNLQEYEIETMVVEDTEVEEYLEKGWQIEKQK